MHDSNSNTDRITVSWTSDDLSTATSNTVTLPKCKNPLCTKQAAFGSDYCRRHGPSFDRNSVDLTDIPQTDSGPSRRDLQRQLDRLEGKLDAVLAALDGGD